MTKSRTGQRWTLPGRLCADTLSTCARCQRRSEECDFELCRRALIGALESAPPETDRHFVTLPVAARRARAKAKKPLEKARRADRAQRQRERSSDL